MTAKILVVDDERDLQELIQRKFRREIRRGEFTFEFANDGVEALEKIQGDAEVELVVSDINMPRMDGLTLLEHLGEYEDQLRTVIISAYGDMENIRNAMNRGAFDFVTKPIDFQDLLITVKKSLDQLDLFKEAIEHRMAAERARGNLARYFSPNMVETLAERDKPFGDARQQNVGVLFTDIRDFTTICESMSPDEVLEMLRSFHDRMTAVVFEYGGTLEKYIGDAMLATFGTPETGEKDATRALSCGRRMLAAVKDWNQERKAAGEPVIGTGVGVHYGPVVLGDIGNESFVAFAVVGDTVNSTSRLEGLTRTLDTDLVVSKALVDQVRSEAGGEASALLDGLEEAGEHPVKGRSGKIPIYILKRH